MKICHFLYSISAFATSLNRLNVTREPKWSYYINIYSLPDIINNLTTENTLKLATTLSVLKKMESLGDQE